MRTKTNHLGIASITVYAAAIAMLLLSGCRKSPEDCQAEYDQVNKRYVSCINQASRDYSAGLLTIQGYEDACADCRAEANSAAREVEGCCCWTDK